MSSLLSRDFKKYKQFGSYGEIDTFVNTFKRLVYFTKLCKTLFSDLKVTASSKGTHVYIVGIK